MPRTVYVVDDDQAVRRALADLLELCGFATRAFASGDEFLAQVASLPEGCILLDLRMPGRSGLDVQRELDSMGISLPVIFLTGHGDVPTSVRAIKAGAFDFLLKPVNDDALLEVLGLAFARLEASAGQRVALQVLRERAAALTPRERQVMGLVARGLRNRDIARQLHISLPTVKVHRMRGMAKLRVASIAQLARIWSAAVPDSPLPEP